MKHEMPKHERNPNDEDMKPRLTVMDRIGDPPSAWRYEDMISILSPRFRSPQLERRTLLRPKGPRSGSLGLEDAEGGRSPRIAAPIPSRAESPRSRGRRSEIRGDPPSKLVVAGPSSGFHPWDLTGAEIPAVRAQRKPSSTVMSTGRTLSRGTTKQ